MGEQAQGHMVMPAPPAVHGIVIHPDLTLALLDRVLARPATGSQACEGGGGRGTRCVGEVGLERSVLISAAPQDEPHLWTRQAVTHRHDSSPGEVHDQRPLAALLEHGLLPLLGRQGGGDLHDGLGGGGVRCQARAAVTSPT